MLDWLRSILFTEKKPPPESDFETGKTDEKISSLSERPETIGACDSTLKDNRESSVDPEPVSVYSGKYSGIQETAVPDTIPHSTVHDTVPHSTVPDTVPHSTVPDTIPHSTGPVQSGTTVAPSQNNVPAQQSQDSQASGQSQDRQASGQSQDSQASGHNQDSQASGHSQDAVARGHHSTASGQILNNEAQDILTPERNNERLDASQPSVIQSQTSESSDLWVCSVDQTCLPVIYRNPDVVIICHVNSQCMASTLRSRLEESALLSEKLTVQFLEEFGSGGTTEIRNFDDLVEAVPCVLMLVDEHYMKDSSCKFYSDVALSCSLVSDLQDSNKQFVIPVFTKNKHNIKGIKATMKSMSGINYYNEDWSESIERKFIHQIDMCLKKKRELQLSKMEEHIAED